MDQDSINGRPAAMEPAKPHLFERLIGGNPAAVAARLAILSVVVGIVLSALGLDPRDIFESITRLFQRIYDMGFEAVIWIFRYFMLGAAIVIPVWIIMRLWRIIPSGRGD